MRLTTVSSEDDKNKYKRTSSRAKTGRKDSVQVQVFSCVFIGWHACDTTCWQFKEGVGSAVSSCSSCDARQSHLSNISTAAKCSNTKWRNQCRQKCRVLLFGLSRWSTTGVCHQSSETQRTMVVKL